MKIGILGTRGIPNHYGGFEQFAENLSVFLANKGHEVYVYNSHTHPYQEKTFQGVHIIHCHDPEDKVGTAGQFLYDFNCIWDSRKRSFDILLQLGYTSSSISHRFLPSKPLIVTNMDGQEWRRSKFSRSVQRFLMWAEKLAVKSSDVLVADSLGIQAYLKEKYSVSSRFIAYGANVVDAFDLNTLAEYGLQKHDFDMLIARLEPENSIETILDGVVQADSTKPFLVIGNHKTEYGEYLKQKYLAFGADRIRFLGGIYDLKKLNDLRYFSNLYFHGHTVGGTNPSLLEAMSSKALICANDNVFNKSVLQDAAYYFKSTDDIAKLLMEVVNIDKESETSTESAMIRKAINRIKEEYTWEKINNTYENLFIEKCPSSRKE